MKTKKKLQSKSLFTTLLVTMAALIMSSSVFAQELAPGRIAISSDGDRADQDDWAAMPVTLALIGKAGLMDRLVHFDYNNKYTMVYSTDTNFTDNGSGYYGPTYADVMHNVVTAAIDTMNYNPGIFYNNRVESERTAAVSSLANLMKRATAEDPLYVLVPGGYNMVYYSIAELTPQERLEKLDNVYFIQHSQNNMDAKGGNGANGIPHNYYDVITDLIAEEELNHLKIPGQGPTLNNHDKTPNKAGFRWLQASGSPAYNFCYDMVSLVYTESVAKNAANDSKPIKSDISDSGMAMYLVELLTQGIDRKTHEYEVSDLHNLLGDSWTPVKKIVIQNETSPDEETYHSDENKSGSEVLNQNSNFSDGLASWTIYKGSGIEEKAIVEVRNSTEEFNSKHLFMRLPKEATHNETQYVKVGQLLQLKKDKEYKYSVDVQWVNVENSLNSAIISAWTVDKNHTFTGQDIWLGK